MSSISTKYRYKKYDNAVRRHVWYPTDASEVQYLYLLSWLFFVALIRFSKRVNFHVIDDQFQLNVIIDD